MHTIPASKLFSDLSELHGSALLMPEEYARLTRLVAVLFKRMAYKPDFTKRLPDLSLLRERYSYDPETGYIYKVRKRDGVYKRLGEKHRSGYVRMNIVIGARRFRVAAHRVAWALHYGEQPPIDMIVHHKDGNKANNQISNLVLLRQSANILLSNIPESV